MTTAATRNGLIITLVLDPNEAEVLDIFTASHATTTEAMLAKYVSRWASENFDRAVQLAERTLTDSVLAGAPVPHLEERCRRLRRVERAEDRGGLVRRPDGGATPGAGPSSGADRPAGGPKP